MVLACRGLVRLTIVHCFRDVVKKRGNDFMGSVTRFRFMGWCSSRLVFHAFCISKLVLRVLVEGFA